MYRFFRDEVEFCLTRHYFLKPIGEHTALERQSQPASLLSTLPAWNELTAVDVQNRWVLQVKAHVVQDNQPDEIRKVQDHLLAIRNELDGVFNFRSIDRKVHDTRVAQQPQGIQALPQRVTVGTV